MKAIGSLVHWFTEGTCLNQDTQDSRIYRIRTVQFSIAPIGRKERRFPFFTNYTCCSALPEFLGGSLCPLW